MQETNGRKKPLHDSFWIVSSHGCKSTSPGSFGVFLGQILFLAFFSHKDRIFCNEIFSDGR